MVEYHGLAHRYLTGCGFLMRPLLNVGTLAGLKGMRAPEAWASLSEALEAILANDALDAESSPTTKTEELEKLVPRFGWPVLESAVLELLAASDQPSHWRIAAEVLWGATLDGRVSDGPRVIAHLCLRYPPGPDEDNLAWSTTCRLKRVGYLSEYNPMNDPDVLSELEKLRERAG